MFLHVLFLALLDSALSLRDGHIMPHNVASMQERLTKARDYPYLGKQGVPMWVPAHVPFFNHGLQHEIQFLDQFWMAWTPDEGSNLITITVAVNTTGWIGVGPTETGSMIGLNPCVIREVDGVMVAQAMHQHSQDFLAPVLNEVQNCRLIDYQTSGGESMATFTRPMVGCKVHTPPEDTDYTGRWDMRIAAAWGATQTFSYHGIAARGTREFHILDGVYVPLPLPDDVQIFDALMLPMYLPNYRDVYLCRGFYFPQDRRYHVVRMDPLLVGNIYPASYHHLLVFQCPEGLPDEYEDPNYTAKCPVIPSGECINYFGGWALGGSNLYFDKYGIPIGVGEGTPRQFLLQTHIDNPNMDDTIFEPGWGFRFFYTPTLRPIDGGTFGFYSGTPLFGIPPQQESYEVLSVCTDSIVGVAFPDGMQIDSVFTHMHGLGRASTLEVIRGSDSQGWNETQKAWQSDFYDTNWQGSRLLRQPGYRIEPGDKLRVTCKWNTMSKNEPTRNGEGFDDEMCIQYINYFPAQTDRRPISICAEFPPGIGLSFADIPPFLGVVGDYEFTPYPSDDGFCSADSAPLS